MSNVSSFHPHFFLLMGIPGLEASHRLLSIFFCIMYVLGLAANSILIFVISANESLHQPMYFFLVTLAAGDLILSSTTVPKTLSIFWFNAHQISFIGCMIQIFFIHFVSLTESGLLMAMAYDRYIAICYHLAYHTKLTMSYVRMAIVLLTTRSFMVVSPMFLLLWRLPYQHSNVIGHTYCEQMSMAQLATASILVNIIYGMVVLVFTAVIDLVLIGWSYISIIKAIMRLTTLEARYKSSSTLISHVCVLLLLYVPSFFSFIAYRVPLNHIPPHVHIIVANLYVLIPPMLNPIIYGVRTKEIQQKVVKMFTWKLNDPQSVLFKQKVSVQIFTN
ncbi:olfactory receptor 52Z1P-like [Hyperolius riggenbachi]|uniref:olfactory receptor 52Z1P-like n=1 Tax=Hyperolius riggenbachi TaxID=752182 RepID=UPI0035A2961D